MKMLVAAPRDRRIDAARLCVASSGRLLHMYSCSTNSSVLARVFCGLRSAVGCKPREAVLYPDSVAGADPRVGPY